MDILVVSSSPNKDGLTAACAQAALQGMDSAAEQAQHVYLNDLDVGLCQACERGWGTCREERCCSVEDDFQDLHARFREADGYILVTPVYFGEPSESMKALLDRLRRCERSAFDGPGGLAAKPVLAIAAAGGSGNGTVTCLRSMERWIEHVGARKTDFIGVTRFTRVYKLEQIAQAAADVVIG